MNESELLPAFINVYFSTVKNIDTMISKPLAQFRLSFEQYQIMYDIAHSPEISLTDIVKKRGVTKPAIARQLRVLRDLGYVSQKLAPDDHRRHILTLTPLGKQIEKKADAATKTEFQRWVATLGTQKMETLLDLFNEIGEKLF